mmetsp:Transcript_41172/g.74389  ORF Transcript_41172/g.74389 Transcript_41172/m.74389 type:complete len:416 (+) Transcript_41172:58-1305(+)
MGCCQAGAPAFQTVDGSPPPKSTAVVTSPPPAVAPPSGTTAAPAPAPATGLNQPPPQPASTKSIGDKPADAPPAATVVSSSSGKVDPPPPADDDPEAYIPVELLGEPCSLVADDLPDWQFELNTDQWRSYPVEEAVEIDRYYQVWQAAECTGPCKAKVKVMKREGIIDFSAMSCQVGTGRPRQLQRKVKHSGWLSNAYFFTAFQNALAGSGVPLNGSAEDYFDFRFNQDFRGMRDDGRARSRGGNPYWLPIGWKRFAVNLRGKYPGDMQWMKEDESGWAVAYHGTSGDSLPGILSSGFRVGSRQKFAKTAGTGIYCTPFIDVAQHYSKPKEQDGHYVQIVLQLRVKPSAIKPVKDPKATDFEKKYWIIEDPEEMRAYGVLIREMSLQDYLPPEAMVFGLNDPAVKKIIADIRAGK